MEDDDDQLAIIEPKDDAELANSESVEFTAALELSDVAMTGFRVSIDGTSNSSGNLPW
jgi:hypothetical protein